MKGTRRHILAAGASAFAAATCGSRTARSEDDLGGSQTKANRQRPWSERRTEIERKWKARQERPGYAETLEYHQTQHQIPPETIAAQFAATGAADAFNWFSFPGGHGLPSVARRLTSVWFDRWLGRVLHD